MNISCYITDCQIKVENLKLYRILTSCCWFAVSAPRSRNIQPSLSLALWSSNINITLSVCREDCDDIFDSLWFAGSQPGQAQLLFNDYIL